MTTAMDLNLLSLLRIAGRDQLEQPGLFLATPPRRPARGRDQDQLLFYLDLNNPGAFQSANLRASIAELAKIYYQTPGSVTSILRYLTEKLNQNLYNQNLQAGANQRLAGSLAAIVLRGQQIYLALSGPIHLFTLTTAGNEHIYDGESTGPGLGINQDASIRYYQYSLQSNDTFILAPRPDPNWEGDTLAGLHGQGPEGLRRRLVHQASSDFNALLLQAKPGKGDIHLLRSATPLPTLSPLPDVDKTTQNPLAAEIQPKGTPTSQVAPVQPASSKVWKILAVAVRPLAGFLRWIGRSLESLFAHMAPGAEPQLPGSVMAIIALAVPVIVVAAASVVYLQRGLKAEALLTYNQALEAVQLAESQQLPAAQREAWQKALQIINTTESYQKNSQTSALRQKANHALDNLDLVKRLPYQPILTGGLPANTIITQILIVDNDLYLLDSRSGNALRAVGAELGYTYDQTFQCGPASTAAIGPLVGLLSGPFEEGNLASLAGVDAAGRIVYCQAGETPLVSLLPDPPGKKYGAISAVAQELGSAYLLDSANNAVWVFVFNDFTKAPESYFEKQAAPLKDAYALAINHNELYALNQDGTLTLCYSGVGELIVSRCTRPVQYIDFRPGSENQPLNPVQPFQRLTYNPPPDPSLYFLDTATAAIYRFSLRNLVFQHKYLPLSNLGIDNATTFTVDADRRLFLLASGNKLYSASLP